MFFCPVDEVHSREHAVITATAAASSSLYPVVTSSVVNVAAVSSAVPSLSLVDHPHMSSSFASAHPPVS